MQAPSKDLAPGQPTAAGDNWASKLPKLEDQANASGPCVQLFVHSPDDDVSPILSTTPVGSSTGGQEQSNTVCLTETPFLTESSDRLRASWPVAPRVSDIPDSVARGQFPTANQVPQQGLSHAVETPLYDSVRESPTCTAKPVIRDPELGGVLCNQDFTPPGRASMQGLLCRPKT